MEEETRAEERKLGIGWPCSCPVDMALLVSSARHGKTKYITKVYCWNFVFMGGDAAGFSCVNQVHGVHFW